jgi:hypothetical protein
MAAGNGMLVTAQKYLAVLEREHDTREMARLEALLRRTASEGPAT